MKPTSVLSTICVLLSASAFAQSEEIEEIKANIRSYEACFEQLSDPTPKLVNHEISPGVSIDVIQATDYKGKSFMQADPDVAKLSIALMDGDNLEEWEVQNADLIFQDGFQTKPGFHIYAHGISDSEGNSTGVRINGVDLTPQETARLILSALDDYELILNAYDSPYPVVLHTCNSAKGPNSFAEQLQKELSQAMPNIRVIAAPKPVYVTLDEAGNYNEIVSTNPAAGDKANGKWHIFSNRGYTVGNKDYKSTMQMIY